MSRILVKQSDGTLVDLGLKRTKSPSQKRRELFLGVVSGVICLCDSSYYYTAFASTSYLSSMQILAVFLGLLLVTDILPSILGSLFRDSVQSTFNRIFLYICLGGIVASFYLFGRYSYSNRDIIYEGNIESWIVSAFLPIVTSVVLFAISFLLNSPKQKINDLTEENAILQEQSRRLQSILNDMHAENLPFKEKLIRLDTDNRNNLLREILVKAAEYSSCVSNYLKTKTDDPSVINALSADRSALIIKNLVNAQMELERITEKSNPVKKEEENALHQSAYDDTKIKSFASTHDVAS